ncbi:MAG: hypothetical protein KF690_07005 [Bacteroidetes bacterium]|nr:hypothetical protein [Bacteroidota bacterium]
MKKLIVYLAYGLFCSVLFILLAKSIFELSGDIYYQWIVASTRSGVYDSVNILPRLFIAFTYLLMITLPVFLIFKVLIRSNIMPNVRFLGRYFIYSSLAIVIFFWFIIEKIDVRIGLFSIYFIMSLVFYFLDKSKTTQHG